MITLPTSALLLSLLGSSPGLAAAHDHHWCSNVILPHSGVLSPSETPATVGIQQVKATVRIVDSVATTTLLVEVKGGGAAPGEAEILIPLPEGAVVRGFAFEGAAPLRMKTPKFQVLSRDDARSTYDAIVAELRDPALLEFAGHGLLRSSAFPVAPGETERIRLTYEEVLLGDGERVDYVLPRTESIGYAVPWTVEFEVKSSQKLADLYSPSHGVETIAGGTHTRTLRVARRHDGRIEAGPVRLSILAGDGGVATTLFASDNPDGDGGWFLLLAGIGDVPDRDDVPPREVTVVLDRSGSMGGKKFDQAIAAARQVLEGLEFGEAIQIIDYAATVERFAPAPVIKTKANLPALRKYLDGLTANGGTNLDGALQAALQAEVHAGFLPVVLFVTDGLATEGEQREHVIRDRAIASNAHGRRIFTFGVGNDVNASLLDAVADRSKGKATYVRPSEDVEVAIGDVFEDLAGPALTDIEFSVAGADGAEDVRLVRDVYPGIMPDLYQGDRLLLVGRYTEARSATFQLVGKTSSGRVSHELDVDFARARPINRFVPRLWAMRRIAALEDSIRQAGADPSVLASLQDDPKFRETVTEMLRLATTHGILTDSTSFLALDSTALGSCDALVAAACTTSYANNDKRSGASGVAQQSNIGRNRSQAWVNSSNVLRDANGNEIAATGVQSIQGRTYFRRGARWTAGVLALDEAAAAEPDREVLVGTPEYATLCRELTDAGRAAELSLGGEILLKIDGKVTLIRQPH